jgi:DNA-binding MarR family transcriptional regulator
MGAQVTASLHELVFAMDAYADRLVAREFGTDHSHFVFLSPLREGALDVTRLAERLNLTKAAVSKRVPVLEQEGWLTVSADPAHGRRVLLALTPRGEAMVAGAGARLNHEFGGLLSGLSIDATAFDHQLRSLIAAVRDLAGRDL